MSMLNHFFDYKPEVLALDEKALELCQPYFKQMEDIRDYNQLKMLKAFADTQMSSSSRAAPTRWLWPSLVCCGQVIPCWLPRAARMTRWKASSVWMARAKAPEP